MATSFKLQALTGVRADWQYSLKVLLHKSSVRPFSPQSHFLSEHLLLSFLCQLSCHYTLQHTFLQLWWILPSMQSAMHHFLEIFVMLKNQKLICPTSSLVVQSLFFFDNLHLNIDLLPERNFSVCLTHPDWLRTHNACNFLHAVIFWTFHSSDSPFSLSYVIIVPN